MGLVASMPMDDWPGQYAEVDVGWAAIGPTGVDRSAWRRHQYRTRRA